MKTFFIIKDKNVLYIVNQSSICAIIQNKIQGCHIVEYLGDLSYEDGELIYDPATDSIIETPDRARKVVINARAAEVRSLRDTRINSVMYVFERDAREKRLGLEPTLTDTQLAEVDRYTQKLCDLPEQAGFPWLNKEIPWPTKPTFLEVK